MKRTAFFVISLFLFVSLFSCNDNEYSLSQQNLNADYGEYFANSIHHWQTGADTLVYEEHSTNDGFCSVCGFEISVYPAGSWINKYDERENSIYYARFDSQGYLKTYVENVFEYDEYGNVLSQTNFIDGVILWKTENKIYDYYDGEPCFYTFRNTVFAPDGSYVTEEFGLNGWAVHEAGFSADGELLYDYAVVNEFNDDGILVGTKKYDGEKIVFEGVHVLDENANNLEYREYSYGKLTKEEFYTRIVEEDFSFGYVSKRIEYDNEGNATVIEYDSEGNVIK